MRIGWSEILIILAIVLLLFGARRLPEIARSIGKGVKEFKRGLSNTTEEGENNSKEG